MPESTNASTVMPTANSRSTQQLIHDVTVQWLREEASVTIDQIDFDAPLHHLGIDSLGLATIASQLEQETNKTLNPDAMYDLETINDLAEYLDGLRPNAVSTSQPVPALLTRVPPAAADVQAAAVKEAV